MLQRRKNDSFNLAFLDVMACGLGAVILIFMLIKFNSRIGGQNTEQQRLQQELIEQQQQHKALGAQVTAQQNTTQNQLNQEQKIQQQLTQLQQQQQQTTQAIKNKQQHIQTLKKRIAENTAAEKKQAEQDKKNSEAVELQGIGEENYLLGLKVEGKEIGILLDHSASMMDETLIDIITRQLENETEKQAGPKWQRTLRIFKWLVARAPKTSKLTSVSFNKTARALTEKPIQISDSTAVKQLIQTANTLTPDHGTDLSLALKKISQINPKITNLYIITDGLPTLGGNVDGLSRYRDDCPSFRKKSNQISGECREILLKETIRQAPLKRAIVNIILLPLEGDPLAANGYWQWSSSRDGLLISPAGTWP